MKSQPFRIMYPWLVTVMTLGMGVSTLLAEPDSTLPTMTSTTGSPLAASQPSTDSTKPAPGFQEGELIPNAIGTFINNSTYPEFEFANPAPNQPNTILLLPSMALEELQQNNQPGRQFIISGQVTLYEGQAYLLMDSDVAIYNTPNSSTEPASAPLAPINPSQAAQENPADILSSLISHHMAERVVPLSTTPSNSIKPDLPVSAGNGLQYWPAIAEGQYVWDEMGRLIKDPQTGQWLIVFQSDGQSMETPPMNLLPCALLTTIQNDDADQGTETAFRVSGLVTEYKGQNYLFLTYVDVFYNLDRF
jgi:hypothetical protein